MNTEPRPGNQAATARAPLVETRMGIQFRPLSGFRAGHFGLVWKECLSDWQPLPDQDIQPHRTVEFDSRVLRPQNDLGAVDATPLRMVLGSPDEMRLFQFQPDQMHMTFRRVMPDCPKFESVRDDFLVTLAALQRMLKAQEVDPIAPNLWELVYVNVIPSGDLWHTPADWGNVFPALFPTGGAVAEGCDWTTFEGEWHFVIPDRFARATLKVSKAMSHSTEEIVLLAVLTLRGQLAPAADGDGIEAWAAAINRAHAHAYRIFYSLASHTAREHWSLLPPERHSPSPTVMP